MSFKFDVWLAEQHDRNDHVGAFARGLNVEGIADKLSRRKYNEHASWVDVVLAMHQPPYVRSFNIAWQEFLVAKVAAESTSLNANA